MLQVKEIPEYNKRCLELLGFVNTTPDDKDFNIYEGKGLYGRTMIETNFSDLFIMDWNWIEIVLEAIEKLPYVSVHFNKTHKDIHSVEISRDVPSYWKKHKQNKYIEVRNISKKEATIEAINNFLIWYNSNPKCKS